MEEFSRGRPDGKPSDPGEGGAAVRTPSKGDSSSPGTAPPSDSPTLIDVPGQSTSVPSSDSPTMVDVPGSDPSDSPTMVDNLGPDSPTMIEGTPLPGKPAPPRIQRPQNNPSMLQPGAILGQRYEILQILGEGGMGAVYKARDRELNRMVALKVIRPELAGHQAIIDRFKQELLLATQVTHKNVIRIYDLSEADGMKFITMEFVEGEDLRGLMQQKGKLEPGEAVEIMQQTCRALEAAHSAGIIHRDLKPQNIMRDKAGRILVMDFGLARTLEGDGMTQTGALVGTMDYMSPEQALGKDLDQRSDVFALGLIFYELLTGKMPFKADSVVASLLKRTQERAAPVSSHDASIPKPLSNIVGKCVEPDLKLRYQSSAEILADLDAWQGGHAAATLHFPSGVRPWGRSFPWHWFGTAAAIVVLAIVGFLFRDKLFRPNTKAPSGSVSLAPHAVLSVLVADFQNNTSDPLFDGTLEPMFNVALEGASFINAYSRGDARKLAEKLSHPTDKLDEQAARLVAVSQGVSAVVTGSLSRRGNGYRLSVEAIDAVTGKTIASADASATNKDEVLLSIPKLAAPIRKALGDNTPESVQLAAAQGTFAASNLEAVHQYSIAMEQQSAGKMEDALQSFSKAVELDPNFARAYAGMAATAGNLGQTQNAEKYAKLAMEHVDRMTERERYFVRGMFYIRTENWQKCVEEYGDLMKQYPADNIGQNNLAFCYGRLLNMPKAMEEARRGLQLTPKDLMARMNFALYACYAGDFQACGREASQALQLNPSYEEAFLVQAYAELGQNQLQQVSETYQKLQNVSAWGASIAAAGRGDLALYQGRFGEAVQIFEKGAAADIATKKPDASADKFAMLAYAQLLRGDKRSALAAAQNALTKSQSVKIRFLAARAFVEGGEIAKARKLAASLASSLQDSPQAYAKLILGEAALKEHNSRQAIQSFTEANNLLDTWLGRFDLGRAYLEAGAFAEADSEFDRCIKRRGEALELFMDDGPTYSYLPVVYYYEGRVREGLKSPDFADFYRTYLNIRGKSAEDPLLAEIHQRIGQ
jgi:eukaryotic-like serine/threonine-protein kinase